MPDVVCAGESMALVFPAVAGYLRHARQLELRVGGAESNVAIGLSRLGVETGWLSVLGRDELGEFVLSHVRAEGVDTSQVERDDAPTGLYLRERSPVGTRSYYYRQGSAASHLAPGAFDPAYLDGARYLHLTGITAALSTSARDFLYWIADEARRRGVRLSFDVNYRARLWSAGDARHFVEDFLPRVDLLFFGDEEATALWGTADTDLMLELQRKGPTEVVLKRGEMGSSAMVDGAVHEAEALKVQPVDSVGAGDAFDAGYLAGLIWEEPVERRLGLGNALGRLCVSNVGDYEPLPSRQELFALIEGEQTLGR